MLACLSIDGSDDNDGRVGNLSFSLSFSLSNSPLHEVHFSKILITRFFAGHACFSARGYTE